MTHAQDCWCPTCKGFRARLEALEAELAEARADVQHWQVALHAMKEKRVQGEQELKAARQTIAVLQEALGIDTSPPTEDELAYARQLKEAGR